MTKAAKNTIAVCGLVFVCGALYLWASRTRAQHITPAPRTDISGVERGAGASLDATGAATEGSQGMAVREEIQSPGDATTGNATIVVHVLRVGSREPVADAIVRVLNEPAKGSDRPTVYAEKPSDKQGFVEFPVPIDVPMSVSVRSKREPTSIQGDDPVFTSPRDRKLKPVVAGEHRKIDIEVYYGRDIDFWGKIVSADDGHPIAGAHIQRAQELRFTFLPDSTRVAPEQITSDEGGLFEIRTSYWVGFRGMRVSSDGMNSGLFMADSGHETREKALLLKLRRSAAIQAHVEDSRATPERISIEISFPRYYLEIAESAGGGDMELFGGPDEAWRAVCDAAGRCTIGDLPSGVPLQVKIRRGREAVLEIPEGPTLEPGEVRPMEWKIGGGALVHGRVSDQDGSSVTKRELWLLRRVMAVEVGVSGSAYLTVSDREGIAARATTDENGTFQIADVAAGRWWLGIAPGNREERRPVAEDVAPIVTLVEVANGESDHLTDLKTFRGLTVSGRVEQPDGSPAVGCEVDALQIEEWNPVADAPTDDAGSFTLGPLAPGGITVRASKVGTYLNSDDIVAQVGDQSLVLVLKAGGSLSVTIVDRTTRKPVQGSFYGSMREPPENSESKLLTADGDHFRFDCIDPGVFDLVAATADGRIGVNRGVQVERATKTKEAVIELEPGGRIRLEYRGSDQEAYCRLFSGDLLIGLVTLKRGESTTRAVLPGTIRIHDPTGDSSEDRFVVVAAGQEQVVVLGNQ